MPSVSLNLEAGATCVTAESPASENHRGSCGSNKGPISTRRFKRKRAASETLAESFPALHLFVS